MTQIRLPGRVGGAGNTRGAGNTFVLQARMSLFSDYLCGQKRRAGIPSLNSFSKRNMLWFLLCRLDMQPRGTGDGWKSGDAFPISDRSLSPSPRIWVGLELLRPTGRSETDARLALGRGGGGVASVDWWFLLLLSWSLGLLCDTSDQPAGDRTWGEAGLCMQRGRSGCTSLATTLRRARPVSVHSHSTVTLLGPSRPSSCQLSAMDGPHSMAHGTETSPA